MAKPKPNTSTPFTVRWDKRSAANGSRRVPEQTLHILALLFSVVNRFKNIEGTVWLLSRLLMCLRNASRRRGNMLCVGPGSDPNLTYVCSTDSKQEFDG
jgi:hypothetical protein